MPNISLQEDNVVIPLELLDDASGEGLVVLSLAKGAYFVIRADIFTTYPRQRLASIRQAIEALREVEAKPEDVEASGTHRKRRGLGELTKQGFAVSDGSLYWLQEQLLPDVTLDLVRQGLASMKGTLAQEVIEERGEE